MNIRTSAVARLVIMGLLLLALLIPLGMVQSVVSERAARRGSVVQEVSSTWGAPQVIGGPVLMVPYVYISTDREGKPQRCVAHAFFLPDVLEIVGTMEPVLLERGLFQAIVYKAHLRITGRFVRPDLTGIRPAPSQVFWEEATVNIGVSDPRGIAKRVSISWNGADVPLAAGVDDSGLFTSGLHMSAGGLSERSNSAIPFAVDLDVNGSREVKFLPAGGDTSLQLTSSWPHPSFSGAPLPAFRESGPSGFTGRWNVPYFGRAYPPRWTNVGLDRAQLKAQADASAVGVILLQPVDIYQQAERAVKYAALFVVMTFVIFFLFEIVRSRLVHPVQYLFVGFAMCVFYLLLVSASEHMGFDVAYASAAAATTLLIGSYAVFVLGGLREGGTMAAGLTTLYAFLYLLLRLEDYALLAGSIGLFLMLALLMYSTRRINWYDSGSEHPIMSVERRPGRRRFLRLAAASMGAAAGLGGYTALIEPYWLELVRRPLRLRNLPPALIGRTLVHISDIHVGTRVDDEYLVETFQRVHEVRPDIVVLTGDFISYHAGVFDQLAAVCRHYPHGRLATLAVLGNHDYGPGWSHPEVAQQVVDTVRPLGITVLRNEVCDVEGIQFAGLDDWWANQFIAEPVLSRIDPRRAAIILTHNPDTVDLAVWGNYDGWILAGHTHGGQCKPPFLPPPLLPVRNVRYTAGEFALSGNRRLYISRGVGHLLRVRFNVRPEVTVFDLSPS